MLRASWNLPLCRRESLYQDPFSTTQPVCPVRRLPLAAMLEVLNWPGITDCISSVIGFVFCFVFFLLLFVLFFGDKLIRLVGFASHPSGAAHSDTDWNSFEALMWQQWSKPWTWCIQALFEPTDICASVLPASPSFLPGICHFAIYHWCTCSVQEICNSMKDDVHFSCMHDLESSKSAGMHPLVLSFTAIQSLRILVPTKVALLSATSVRLLSWDGAFMLSRSLCCPAKWTHPAKIVDFLLWSKKLVAKSGKSPVPVPVSLLSSAAKWTPR